MAFGFKCYINSFDVLIYKLKICMQRRACLSSHEAWLCSVFMAPLQLDWLSLHSRSHFWSSSECQQWMLQSIPRRYLGRTQVTWTINLSQISNNNYSFSLSTSIVGLHICRWSIFTSLHLHLHFQLHLFFFGGELLSPSGWYFQWRKQSYIKSHMRWLWLHVFYY